MIKDKYFINLTPSGIGEFYIPYIDEQKKYKKDIYQSYKKVGGRNLVAGQEDLIPDILSEIDQKVKKDL